MVLWLVIYRPFVFALIWDILCKSKVTFVFNVRQTADSGSPRLTQLVFHVNTIGLRNVSLTNHLIKQKRNKSPKKTKQNRKLQNIKFVYATFCSLSSRNRFGCGSKQFWYLNRASSIGQRFTFPALSKNKRRKKTNCLTRFKFNSSSIYIKNVQRLFYNLWNDTNLKINS